MTSLKDRLSPGARSARRPQAKQASGEQAGSSRRTFLGVTADGGVAVLTWLVCGALALLLVDRWDLDPFSVGGAVMPVGVGSAAGALVLAIVLRGRSDGVFGLATGVYAAWVALTLAAALHGTPFGFGRMAGDAGRFTAMATRYALTTDSADPFVPSLPSEYPPLYPWIVGRLSRLLDEPAWTLFGDMQIVVMSASFVFAYLLWRRLVSPGVAFVIVALAPAVWADPGKDYEFLALMIFAPWVLGTFVRYRRRGGLHWLPAGVIGAFLVCWYQAWLLYSAAGLLLLVVLAIVAAKDRSRYLLHLLGVAVTAFLLSAWYVVPLFSGLLDGAPRVSDFWMSGAITDRPLVLPLMQVPPLAVAELVGLLGMVWYWRSTWWAQPLLILVLGNYVYRVAFLIKTAQDNHTGYLQYTETVIGMLLLTAGVLTASEAGPALRQRVLAGAAGLPRERTVVVTVVVVLVGWAAVQGWQSWIPGPRGLRDSVAPAGVANRATDAHAELLPDGTPTRFAPGERYQNRAFPSGRVEAVIRQHWKGIAEPVVLSDDQRLFSFTAHQGYNAVDRVSSNSLLKWDERTAELTKLRELTDPDEFAAASQRTRFGNIDVFVLQATGGRWFWGELSFSPKSFAPEHFHIERLPNRTVVAVRKA